MLWTERSGAPQDLIAADFTIGGAWHNYRITAVGRKITVAVDEKPVINFTDGEAGSLSGGFALEAFGTDGARFDNIKLFQVKSGG